MTRNFNKARNLSKTKRVLSPEKNSVRKGLVSTRAINRYFSPNDRYSNTKALVNNTKGTIDVNDDYNFMRCSSNSFKSIDDGQDISLYKPRKSSHGSKNWFDVHIFDKQQHLKRVEKLKEIISDAELDQIRDEIMKSTNVRSHDLSL